jgi:hypothetical protein
MWRNINICHWLCAIEHKTMNPFSFQELTGINARVVRHTVTTNTLV